MTNKVKKYVTIEEGVDFRTIAKIMSEHGYKMNHATARNVLINAIRSLMNYTAEQVGTKIPEEAMEKIIKDQDIHMALADVLHQACNTNKTNEKYSGEKNVKKRKA